LPAFISAGDEGSKALLVERSVVRILLVAPDTRNTPDLLFQALGCEVRLASDAPSALVHNRPVVERFRQHGVIFVDHIREIPSGATVLPGGRSRLSCLPVALCSATGRQRQPSGCG
jgi:hypothetical protein